MQACLALVKVRYYSDQTPNPGEGNVTGHCGREQKQQWIQTAKGRLRDKGTRRKGSEIRSWMEERE